MVILRMNGARYGRTARFVATAHAITITPPVSPPAHLFGPSLLVGGGKDDDAGLHLKRGFCDLYATVWFGPTLRSRGQRRDVKDAAGRSPAFRLLCAVAMLRVDAADHAFLTSW